MSWKNKRIQFTFVGSALLILIGFLMVPQMRHVAAEYACDQHETQNQKIDCWNDVVDSRVQKEGIVGGIREYSRLYRFSDFAQSGCHKRSHWLGDRMYYESLTSKDSSREEIIFPDGSALCGYGMITGFFEHYIQNLKPRTLESITQTCEYFGTQYGSSMRDIQVTCYHAAGHGLLYAHAEELPRQSWGSTHEFVDEPLRTCDTLPKATDFEKDNCRNGVFHVLVDLMTAKQFGFAYDAEHPFLLCEDFKKLYKSSCYYGMLQPLNQVTHADLGALVSLYTSIVEPVLRDRVFWNGIAGMERLRLGTNGHVQLLDECAFLDGHLFSLCVKGIVFMLFEDGPPGKEYVVAQSICTMPLIEKNGAIDSCWNVFEQRIRRLYPPKKAGELCKLEPVDRQASCVTNVTET